MRNRYAHGSADQWRGKVRKLLQINQLRKKLLRRPRIEALERRCLLAADLGWEIEAISPVVVASPIQPLSGSESVSQSVPISQLPGLSSNPAAAAKVYLDFDGHFESVWGSYRDITTPVFSLDGDLSTFTDAEIAAITEVWQRVSEDFAPFNIDVTTINPGNFDNRVGLRVSIGGNGSWFGSAGGVAYRNTWTNSIVNTVYVFSQNLANTAKYIAEASSHESGHAFGLYHQSRYDASGNKTDEYNPGSGDWAPIMGLSYYKARSTWHNGTTTSATTFQDDMAVISSSNNAFGYRADDHGSVASPTTLTFTAGLATASGTIERMSDQDAFGFQTTGGQVNVTLDVAAVGPNLDSVLELRDGSGNLIVSSSPSGSYGATISETLSSGAYVIVVASAGQYGSVGQYSLEVTASSNSAPTANDDGYTVAEDSLTTRFDVLANDTTLPDTGETLTITAASAGSAGGTITIVNGTAIDYRPAADFFGQETFTYTINDGIPGNNDTATVSVTVLPLNDNPTANDDGFSVAADSSAQQLDVLANDTIAPDTGETLTILSVGAGSAGGTILVTAGGTAISYAPASGFTGQETFSYTVNDGTPGSNDTATVTVNVATVNHEPTANDDSYSLDEDSGTSRLDVLTNDSTAPDTGETLAIISVSAGSAGGTIVITAGGSAIDYAPAADYFGQETFSYTINDGTPGSNATASVTISVQPVNDLPTAANDSFTLYKNSASQRLNVLGNDTIVPDTGETLTIISAGTGSAGGTVSVAADGSGIDYAPAPGYVGDETFTYVVNDGTAGSNATATVMVHVEDLLAIDLRNYSIDSYGGRRFDEEGTATVEDSGATLHLVGNIWKKIDFAYNVTANTVIEFDFRSSVEGDLHGLGFDTDIKASQSQLFKLHGSQRWGIRNYDNYAPPDSQHYVIPVGQFYTGDFSHLFFANEHDVSNPAADSYFSNIVVYEASSADVARGLGAHRTAAAGDAHWWRNPLSGSLAWTTERTEPLGDQTVVSSGGEVVDRATASSESRDVELWRRLAPADGVDGDEQAIARDALFDELGRSASGSEESESAGLDWLSKLWDAADPLAS